MFRRQSAAQLRGPTLEFLGAIMTPYLKHFGDSEIIINAEQAAAILKFYFPDAAPSPSALNKDDIGFAQGLLLAGIDSSYEMGFAEILFRIVGKYVPPTFGDIKEIAREFAKHAIHHWFRHATGKDLQNPQIYESVRNSITLNFKSAWAIRQATGELTY
jgi:hypothetical protein